MLKIRNKRKIGLVLSGGGPKAAAFHIGVCLALQEKGFRFIGGTRDTVEDSSHVNDPLAIKLYVGSSAGAMVCSLLASGHSVNDIIDSFQLGAGLLKTPRRKSKLRPMGYLDMFSISPPLWARIVPSFWQKKLGLTLGGIETLLKNYVRVPGLFSAKGIESYIRQFVVPTNSFGELGVEFFAVASSLNRSRKTVFGPTSGLSRLEDVLYCNTVSISDAVTASLSLPPVFAPWTIKHADGNDEDYYDGEIRETLSTHVAADNDADLIIASYSIKPYEFNPEVGSLKEYGLPAILNQALYHVVEQKIQRSIMARENIRQATNTVMGYFKENDLPLGLAENLCDIIWKKTGFKKDVDYIYIHPQPQNSEMFFADHFSLNPEVLGRIVKIGFRSAIGVLRKYDV